MRTHMGLFSRFGGRLRRKPRGIALITTLLLLMLLMALALTMVLSVSSDVLINGYYRDYRASFYAADSGLNIIRQDMVNQFLGLQNANFQEQGQQPITTGTEATVLTNIINKYKSSQSLGQPASGWPGQFSLDTAAGVVNTLTLSSCGLGYTWTGTGNPTPLPSGYSCTNAPPINTLCTTPTSTNCYNPSYSYVFSYEIYTMGQSKGTETTILKDKGSLIFNATTKPSGPQKRPFSGWGTFLNTYAICDSPLVPGTFTGPVFSNDSINFGDSGLTGSSSSYVFTDSVGTVNAKAGYEYSSGNGHCDPVTGSSDKYNGTTIAPQFQSGFKQGQNSIPLPGNSFSQEQAVLDGIGDCIGTPPNCASPNQSTMNSVLKSIVPTTSYPATGTGNNTKGVWIPYTTKDSSGKTIPPTFTGGGFLVGGDASVVISINAAGAQVYAITQGSTTTTITVSNATNTTTVSDNAGHSTLTIIGVPMMYADGAPPTAVGPATMLYVEPAGTDGGNITSLKGPGEGKAAIQDGTALTITASGNVTITGDILYKTEPVTTTQNQIPGTPADTLIPGNDKGQVLGIFTATGDVQMNNSQSDGNLEIDASIAMISTGGSGGWINVGNHINTLTLLGGRIANQAKSGNTTTRNIWFDRRFAQGSFSPPWFPSTTIIPSGQEASTIIPSFQRVEWLDVTHTQ